MQHQRIHLGALGACAALALALSGCNGSNTPDATIGGTVSGLAAGASVTLAENSATILAVSSNGAFELPVGVPADQTYSIAVQSQPAGQMCSVSNAAGSVDDNGDPINNVTVSCQSITTIGGSVAGLTGNGLLSLSDGTSTLAVTANGNFAFADAFAPSASYTVTVAAQPAGQTCHVNNGSGTIDATADSVNTISVACATNQTLAGVVTGLVSSSSGVTLSDGVTTLVLAANGLFDFVDAQAPNASYAVVVVAQPQGQTCAVVNGSGSTDANADAVTNIGVNCSVNGSVSGTVTGLAAGATLVLGDGTSLLNVGANGSFTMPDVFSANSAYAVTVQTQPTGQTCTVANGSGITDSNDDAVNSVSVSCM